MKKGVMALALMMATWSVQAGTLDDFEKKATKNSGSDSKEKNAKSDSSFGLFDLLFGGEPVETAITEKLNEEEPLGEPDRPFAQLGFYGSEISSSVYLKDYEIELGYGPFSLTYKESKFKETEPRGKLTLQQAFAALTQPIADGVEVFIGKGLFKLGGNKMTHEHSNHLGVTVNIVSGLDFDYRYSASDGGSLSLTDHEASFSYTFKNIGIKAGYRKVDTAGADLTGPFTGFSLQF